MQLVAEVLPAPVRTAESLELWRRLEAYVLDNPSCGLTFTERAARENGWTPHRTRRVIAEYKRFLYLAMTCPHVVCPSDAVDQVWHMHLTYTRSYWEDLCPHVLRQPLHHGPTQGGSEEHEKHYTLYLRTLQSYREAFGIEPPADIWPSAEQRFGTDLAFIRVNAHHNWIIPKPKWSQAALGAAGAGLAIPLAQLAANPLDWNGPQFLALYFCLFVFAAAASWIGKVWMSHSHQDYRFQPGDSNAIGPIEAAWMQGGAPRAVSCALLELAQKEAIRLDDVIISQGPQIGKVRADHRVSDLILNSVAASTHGRSYRIVAREANVGLETLRQGLIEKGLVLDWSQRASAMALPIALFGGLIGFGIAKAIVGLGRDKPIGFLVLAVLLTILALSYFIKAAPKLTKSGRKLMSRLRQEAAHHPEKLLAPQVASTPAANDASLLWSTAFLGTAVLASTQWASYDTFLTRQMASNSGSSSGGCGTSGCGGDGGGGCGGGGCGGCGGD